MTALHRTCILVAENDVLTRNLISTILSHEGHLVLAAANKAEALQLSRTYMGEIQLLVAKCRDLAETIAREHPETRVILLSASTSLDLKESARKVHPGAFQQAGLPEKLHDCIQRALQDPHSGAFVEV